jgi:hypothetical protein
MNPILFDEWLDIKMLFAFPVCIPQPMYYLHDPYLSCINVDELDWERIPCEPPFQNHHDPSSEYNVMTRRLWWWPFLSVHPEPRGYSLTEIDESCVEAERWKSSWSVTAEMINDSDVVGIGDHTAISEFLQNLIHLLTHVARLFEDTRRPQMQ